MKTVVRATLWKLAPAASSSALMFSITRVVCSTMPPGTSCPDTGSSGIDPDRNNRLPTLSAGEYGPIALAAPAAVTSSRICLLPRLRLGSGSLRNLVGAEAARADLDALTRAVHHGSYRLQVGLEAAGTHVMSVGHTATDYRTLAANFTSHSHDGNSSVPGNREFYHGNTMRGLAGSWAF